MWAKFVRSDFFLQFLIFKDFIPNNKISKNLNYKKSVAYLFCTTLNVNIKRPFYWADLTLHDTCASWRRVVLANMFYGAEIEASAAKIKYTRV